MYKGKSIGVVVPALNEEMLIVPTLASMPAFIDRIYAVEDGSMDNTLGRMREAAAMLGVTYYEFVSLLEESGSD